MSNEMHSLVLYRHQQQWVYDDARFGRVAEPLVLGASEILDTIIQADLGYHTREPVGVLFSAQDFPGAHRGDWVRKDSGGNWYALGQEECWLCPALFDYFPQAPAHLYVRAHSLEAGRSA